MADEKQVLKNTTDVHTVDGTATAVANYITQVNAGGTVYDIATHHGIKFFNGQTDTEGVSWNGLSELEVIIPSVTDLVQDPIRFAGTEKPGTPQKGDLVFFTTGGTDGNIVYEAGDMAIYDGSKWNYASGEDQVEILGGTGKEGSTKTDVVLSASAKSVLFVEGKELTLALPAALLKDNLRVAKNAATDYNLETGAKATVTAKYVTLTYTAGTDTVIGKNKTINIPTALNSDEVTISGDNDIIKPTDIAAAWTAGKDGDTDSAAVDVKISGGIDLTPGTGSDFVTSVSASSTADVVKEAIKSATLSVKNQLAKDETIATQAFLVGNPTLTNDTTTFATGVETATGEEIEFTVPGAVSTEDKQSSEGADFVKNVTMPELGDADSYTDAHNESADADTGFLTSIGNPTVSISNGDVLSSAKVTEDHVLVLGTATVSATYNAGTPVYKKAQYKKTVISNADMVGATYGAIKIGAAQGYKLTKQAVNVTLNDATVMYMGVATEAADSTAKAITGISAQTGAYTAAFGSDAKGSIAADTVITGVTFPTLPTLGAVSATGSISAKVASTALKAATSDITVGEFASSWGTSDVKVSNGTYALGDAASAPTEKGVTYATVGANGNMGVSGKITIAADTYVTEVYANADLKDPISADKDTVAKLA